MEPVTFRPALAEFCILNLYSPSLKVHLTLGWQSYTWSVGRTVEISFAGTALI